MEILFEDNGYYGPNPESPSMHSSQSQEDKNKELMDHATSVNGLLTANAIVIILFMILVAAVAAVVAGLIYYHYSNRPKRWIKITKIMHQRLSKQILQEEKLKELCQIIAVSAETINADRKQLCPDIEEMVDLPAARYVDPFKAPSNLYEQIKENDDDAKTLKNIDPDVFIKKDEMQSSGASTNPSIKAKDQAPGEKTGTTLPAATAIGGVPSSAEKGGNAPAPIAPSTTTPATAIAPMTDGKEQQQQKVGSLEPPKPEEKKSTEKCDKPPEVIKSVQA